MAVNVKSTSWTKSSVNSTGFTKSTVNSTGFTKGSVNSTSFAPGKLFSDNALLLSDGTFKLLLSDSTNFLGLTA